MGEDKCLPQLRNAKTVVKTANKKDATMGTVQKLIKNQILKCPCGSMLWKLYTDDDMEIAYIECENCKAWFEFTDDGLEIEY